MWTSRRQLQVITSAALLATLASGSVVLAEPEPSARERTTAILAEGADLYKKGDLRRALGNFQAAFELFPSPKIHYNIGLAYQGLGRNAEALKAYERFLGDARDAPPDTLADARARAKTLETKVARLVLVCESEDADVLIDSAPVGRTPLAGRLPVDPGRHELVVRSAHFGTQTRSFTAVAGRPVEVRVEMAAGKTAAAFTGSTRRSSEAASGAAAAEALIAEATELRRAGRHSKAYPLLSRAYSAHTSARTAAQLGLVELDLGYWLDSEQHLGEGLASPRDLWIASHREDLEASLARVKAAIGELVISGAPAGSEVLVNGRPAGRLPLAAPVRVGEGPVNLEVRTPGRPSEFRSLIMLGGQRQEVAMAPAAPPPVSSRNARNEFSEVPAEANDFRSYRRPLAWTAAGLTAGALAFAGYETVSWQKRLADFDKYRSPASSAGPKTCGADDPNRGAAGCARIYADFQRARTLAIISYLTAGALAVTTATLFFLSSSKGDSTELACGFSLSIAGGTCRLNF